MNLNNGSHKQPAQHERREAPAAWLLEWATYAPVKKGVSVKKPL
jgi:hypothetical protein